MKVIIVTEGGKNIGFGHITRCLALQQVLTEKVITTEFIIDSAGDIDCLLKEANFRKLNWLKDNKKLLKLINNTDTVIIDSYLAEKSLYNKISELCNARVVMIDDFNRMKYPKGIVVNPSIFTDKFVYTKTRGVVYLLGSDYIIVRKEFRGHIKKNINREIKDVLLTFGGAVNNDFIFKILNYLKSSFSYNFKVLGSAKTRLDASGMLDVMLKADICICAGGQTTYELARVGVPVIGICFAENQLYNLQVLEEKGFIRYVGWCNGNNLLQNLSSTIEELSAHEIRLKMSNTGRKLVDGRGAERIINILLRGMASKAVPRDN